MKKHVLRALIEVGFIIFLFYSNLLMGEFERSEMGLKRGRSVGNRRCLYYRQFRNCRDGRAHWLCRC